MMVHDIDAPGLPAYGNKTQSKAKPKKPCPFNEGVECRTFKCENCGFNPERKRGKRMDEGKSSYNFEAENDALKKELAHAYDQLKACETLLNETRKELENYKLANSEMEDELLRYEGKISAFEFVLKNGR